MPDADEERCVVSGLPIAKGERVGVTMSKRISFAIGKAFRTLVR